MKLLVAIESHPFEYKAIEFPSFEDGDKLLNEHGKQAFAIVDEDRIISTDAGDSELWGIYRPWILNYIEKEGLNNSNYSIKSQTGSLEFHSPQTGLQSV